MRESANVGQPAAKRTGLTSRINSVTAYFPGTTAGSRMDRPLALLLLLTLAGCDDTPGQWSSIVYPDAADRSHWQRTDRFKTEAMCKQSAEETIATLTRPEKAGFECVRAAPGKGA